MSFPLSLGEFIVKNSATNCLFFCAIYPDPCLALPVVLGLDFVFLMGALYLRKCLFWTLIHRVDWMWLSTPEKKCKLEDNNDADSVISSQKEKPKFTILCWSFLCWLSGDFGIPGWIFCLTTIDLISHYQWVTEGKTAFICPFGLFQFEVIPFRTCCLPETNRSGCDRPPR